MREKITVKWLQEMKACGEAIIKFREQTETDSIKILQKLINHEKSEDNKKIFNPELIVRESG